MPESRLPTEVELVYEVLPCQALRTSQEPTGDPHACSYFRRWGTYHSYDYTTDGPPPEPGIVQRCRYMGRAPMVPEVLSGCRKAPIMAVGINPNMPGWWRNRRRSLAPLFDDYRQYAHYFRYRAVHKLELSQEDYARYGGGPEDTPFSDFELQVPPDDDENRIIEVQLQPQAMYQAYQELLVAVAATMGWPDGGLSVGEDLSYGNMVASPSAKWTTAPSPRDPTLPPMSRGERDGIVSECFRKRRYFLRQLFQSLPSILLVFSQSTANALIGEIGHLLSGDPVGVGEPLAELATRNVRLRYGPGPADPEARVIFSPHITGNPADFAAARDRVVAQIVEEARAGNLGFDPATGHLERPPGACVFCPMLEIGPCDYEDGLRPLSGPIRLHAGSPVDALLSEKRAQTTLLERAIAAPSPNSAWDATDDVDEPEAVRQR